MKKFKNTIMVILAIMPTFAIMLYAVTNFHSTEPTPFMDFGEVTLTNANNTISVSYTQGTICEKALKPLYGEGALPPLYNTTAKMAQWLKTNIGFPVEYTLFTFAYGLYIFLVEMTFMLINLIAFIPRKCSEIFGG